MARDGIGAVKEVRWLGMKKVAKRVKTHVLIIISFFLIGIIAFEIYLRINHFSFNPPFFKEDIPFINRENVRAEGLYQFDFFLFWRYRPCANEQINSLGFRDQEFLIAKKSQFRIIVLGDSCTAGHQLPSEKTYSKYLETTHHRSDISIENADKQRSKD